VTAPTIVSFWHGPLGWLERLSITSFLRHGHPVAVYSFDPLELPPGAERRDAAEILGRDTLVFYKDRGTPAVFSDRFRLELLRHNLGIYADLDVYCVRPFPQNPDYLMGWERPGSVNNAVLHIPADAPLLADLLGIFEPANRPLLEPHLPLGRRLEVAARRLLGQKVLPHQMQFGATGPFALTHFMEQRGLLDRVQPQQVFYPLAYEQIPALMQPGSSVDEALRPETLSVHLWRSQLTNRGRATLPPPPPGSAMRQLCEREGIALD
jgi:hypothetical protein